MLFAKSLRNLASGLLVAAASLGLTHSASADVVFDVSSIDATHTMGSYNNGAWFSDSIGNFVKVNLSGSSYAALQGFTQGFLQFSATPTGPITNGPTVPLTGSFIITSGNFGTGTVLLAGTGTSTLTRASDSSVTWTSDVVSFTSDVVAPAEFGSGQSFSLTFSATNKPITAGSSFPQFTSFELSGSFVAVPEPSTFALLGLGVAGLGIRAYRRRKAMAV